MAKKKKGPGRPLKIVPESEILKAEEYALLNCQNNTICGLLGWDYEWLSGRLDILKRLTKKRQEHKVLIRQAQQKQLNTPVMAIWMGKNALGQADRKDLTSGGRPIAVSVVDFASEKGKED